MQDQNNEKKEKVWKFDGRHANLKVFNRCVMTELEAEDRLAAAILRGNIAIKETQTVMGSIVTPTHIYTKRKDIACAPADDGNGITKVIDPWTNQQIGYNYKVTGTTFKATCDNKPNSQPCGSSSNSRRRRLLQDEYGNSGERL